MVRGHRVPGCHRFHHLRSGSGRGPSADLREKRKTLDPIRPIRNGGIALPRQDADENDWAGLQAISKLLSTIIDARAEGS